MPPHSAAIEAAAKTIASGIGWSGSNHRAREIAATVLSAPDAMLSPRPVSDLPDAFKDGRDVLLYHSGFGMGWMVLHWARGGWVEKTHGSRLTIQPEFWAELPATNFADPQG